MTDHLTQDSPAPANTPPLPMKATRSEPEITTPIIVSLGKKKKKAIKQLKRGKGSAMEEVLDVVDQVQETLGDQAAGKIIVPVVVIYRRKQRRIRGLF
jgi:hypothetical protein